MLRFLVAFGALTMAAAPAAAQFRAEIHAGYNGLRSDDGDIDGSVYGLGLGYDWNLGNAVVGVEANLDASSGRTCENDVIIAGDRACVRPRRDLSALLRVGVATSSRGMVYASGGYANLRLNGSYDDGTTVQRASDDLDGARLAIGYQHRLGGRTYAKFEYRYSNYEAEVSSHQGLIGFGIGF